jgi:hypothetical protein
MQILWLTTTWRLAQCFSFSWRSVAGGRSRRLSWRQDIVVAVIVNRTDPLYRDAVFECMCEVILVWGSTLSALALWLQISHNLHNSYNPSWCQVPIIGCWLNGLQIILSTEQMYVCHW